MPRPMAGAHKGARTMESSRRYLLQAEIDYWHEMLRINRHRLGDRRQHEMRQLLRDALRALNTSSPERFKAVA